MSLCTMPHTHRRHTHTLCVCVIVCVMYVYIIYTSSEKYSMPVYDAIGVEGKKEKRKKKKTKYSIPVYDAIGVQGAGCRVQGLGF
jgi:hypothetical protein